MLTTRLRCQELPVSTSVNSFFTFMEITYYPGGETDNEPINQPHTCKFLTDLNAIMKSA